jgi:hypothetical protein
MLLCILPAALLLPPTPLLAAALGAAINTPAIRGPAPPLLAAPILASIRARTSSRRRAISASVRVAPFTAVLSSSASNLAPFDT